MFSPCLMSSTSEIIPFSTRYFWSDSMAASSSVCWVWASRLSIWYPAIAFSALRSWFRLMKRSVRVLAMSAATWLFGWRAFTSTRRVNRMGAIWMSERTAFTLSCFSAYRGSDSSFSLAITPSISERLWRFRYCVWRYSWS